MSTVTSTYITPEEYLERERKAETKSEYFRGEIFAMAGTSLRHARIVTNFARELSQALRERPCNVYTTEVRLCVSQTGLYTYPDVMVVCGKEVLAASDLDTVTNPTVVIEVLSDSTKNYDRGQKFQSYRALPSLAEYLTVSQNEMHVELWTRQPDQRWILTEYSDPGATIVLPSLGVELPLPDVYEKVDFSAK